MACSMLMAWPAAHAFAHPASPSWAISADFAFVECSTAFDVAFSAHAIIDGFEGTQQFGGSLRFVSDESQLRHSL